MPQTPYNGPPQAFCISSPHHWNPVTTPESHVLCCSFVRDLLLPSRRTLVSWKHLNMTKKCSFITGLWMWLKSIKISLMRHSRYSPFNKKFWSRDAFHFAKDYGNFGNTWREYTLVMVGIFWPKFAFKKCHTTAEHAILFWLFSPV